MAKLEVVQKVKVADIAFGKDNFTYLDVLNDFRNAKYIFISTYNITEINSNLISRLKNLQNVEEIIFVSNIPDRWDTYFGNANNKAKKSISRYLKALDPRGFKSPAKVYFNFCNHSKVIMTENTAYVGSANFSEKNKMAFFEMGVILNNKDLIEDIKENIVPIILSESIRYAGSEYNYLEEKINEYLGDIKNTFNSITNLLTYDDYDPMRKFRMNFEGGFLNKKIFRQLDNDVINLRDFFEKDAIYIKYEVFQSVNWHETLALLESFIETDEFTELASADEQDLMDDFISKCGGEFSDEDAVEDLINRAGEKAIELREDIMCRLGDQVIDLEKSVEALIDSFNELFEKLYDIKAMEKKIDNTSL